MPELRAWQAFRKNHLELAERIELLVFAIEDQWPRRTNESEKDRAFQTLIASDEVQELTAKVEHLPAELQPLSDPHGLSVILWSHFLAARLARRSLRRR